MMNALIGKEVNDIPDTQVCNNKYLCICTILLFKVIRFCYVQIGIFLKTATKTVENASNDIHSCCDVLEDIIKKVCDMYIKTCVLIA